MNTATLTQLRSTFGDRLQEKVPLSGYTAARIGGPADALIIVRSKQELAQVVEQLWALEAPFQVIGGGSNLLASDQGVRGVVVVNRARAIHFDLEVDPPCAHAESGVTPNDLVQRAARLGLTGFEWAGGIPGTLGGAVYGNAGAFGGDMAGCLVSVEVLHRKLGLQVWKLDDLGYGYRTSIFKRDHPPAVILSAQLELKHGDPQEIQGKLEQYAQRRRKTQPPGASMGSMFKNPPGDKAGRLIEAAGLKGTRIGNAEISTQHANFFINSGLTRALDMQELIELARKSVADKFGINLELEVELIGEW